MLSKMLENKRNIMDAAITLDVWLKWKMFGGNGRS